MWHTVLAPPRILPFCNEPAGAPNSSAALFGLSRKAAPFSGCQLRVTPRPLSFSMTSRCAGMTETLGFFVPHLTYQLALDRLQSRCRNGPWTQQTFRMSSLLIGVVFWDQAPPPGFHSPCPLKVLWMPCNVHAQTHPQNLTPGGLRNYAMPERLRFGFGCRSGIIISQVASLGLMLSRTPRLCCRANALTLINIMALLYRGSCKAITRQVLQSLSLRLPPSIAGGLPCRSADLLWYHTQFVIEQALATDTEMFGAVTDLQKFFNSVPRFFLKRLLITFGIDAAWVTQWIELLDTMKKSVQDVNMWYS